MKNAIIDIIILPFAMMAGLITVVAGVVLSPILLVGYFTGKTKVEKTENGFSVEYKSHDEG